MNEKKKRIGRLIAFILLSALFAAISVFFIMVLISSNDTFFNSTASQSKFFVPDIMIAVIIAAIAIMAVLLLSLIHIFKENQSPKQISGKSADRAVCVCQLLLWT